MAKKSFKCGRCKRTFGMAAHLARHVGAMHKAGRTAKKATVRKKGTVGRPKGRAKTVRAGAAGPARVIGDLRTYRDGLVAQCRQVEGEIARIEKAIATLSGSAKPSTKRAQAKRAKAPAKKVRRRVGRPKGTGKARRGPGRPKGTKATGQKGRPAGRPGSLKAYIARVVTGSSKPKSPKDIAAAVVGAGYKTKSKNLVRSVSNALSDVPGVKRIGHGMYGV